MKKKFTLNELIVTVALVSIGACAVAAVAEKTVKPEVTACANNMKQLSLAALQYAKDNNNTLPGTTYDVGKNWQLRIAPYLGYKNVKPGWRPNDYPIYKCPADKTAPAKFLAPNAHIAKISYCANLTLIDFDTADANTDRHKGGRNLDKVAKHNMTILFAEDHSPNQSLRYGAAAKCYQPGYTYEYSKPRGTLENDDAKVGYHDYKNNWAMLDGHVEYMNYEATLKPVNRWILHK